MAFPRMADRQKRGGLLLFGYSSSDSDLLAVDVPPKHGYGAGAGPTPKPLAAPSRNQQRLESHPGCFANYEQGRKALLRRQLHENEDAGNQRSKMPSRASSSTAVAPGRELTTLQPLSNEFPKGMKAAQLEKLRRAVNEERTSSDRFMTSEASPSPTEEQRRCPHPWSRFTVLNAMLVMRSAFSSGMTGVACQPKGSTCSGLESWPLLIQVVGMQLVEKTGAAQPISEKPSCDAGLQWTEVAESEWFKFGARKWMQWG